MRYKFPGFDTVFTDPVITINGDVGTKVNNNIPEDVAYCDILITTPQTSSSSYRLEGSPKPLDRTMESLSSWVADQLVNYEIT